MSQRKNCWMKNYIKTNSSILISSDECITALDEPDGWAMCGVLHGNTKGTWLKKQQWGLGECFADN